MGGCISSQQRDLDFDLIPEVLPATIDPRSTIETPLQKLERLTKQFQETPVEKVIDEMNHGHKRYRPNAEALLNCPAGRFEPREDDLYFVLKYNSVLEDLLEQAFVLEKMFYKVGEAHALTGMCQNQIMNVNVALGMLRGCYEKFFIESRWNIDRHMQARKNMVRKAYFSIEAIKDEFYTLMTAEMDFDVRYERCEDLVNYQVEAVKALFAHFRRTHRNVPKVDIKKYRYAHSLKKKAEEKAKELEKGPIPEDKDCPFRVDQQPSTSSDL